MGIKEFGNFSFLSEVFYFHWIHMPILIENKNLLQRVEIIKSKDHDRGSWDFIPRSWKGHKKRLLTRRKENEKKGKKIKKEQS